MIRIHHITGARAARLVAASAIGIIAVLAACASDTTAPSPMKEVDGASVAIGGGSARTFVLSNDAGAATLGIELTDAALTQLPTDMAEWQLPLPAGVSVTPWDHVAIDWNPQGHEPMGIYGVPHFDFHFYTIPVAAQMAIQGGPDATPVAASYVPQDYVSQVMSVPAMGVHWADTLSAEFHGHPFDKTFIYGFTKGQMNFVEPMITLAFLQGHPAVATHVKQSAAVQVHGRYPTSYGVHHDATRRVTRITLDSLVTR